MLPISATKSRQEPVARSAVPNSHAAGAPVGDGWVVVETDIGGWIQLSAAARAVVVAVLCRKAESRDEQAEERADNETGKKG